MPLALFALAVAAFGIGTTEFVIMGLLPDVANDLHVSIPSAGLLITGYALGVVFGAPILAIATANMPRRATLLGMTLTFVLGNALCALAPNYTALMSARVITALCHGAFFGIGSVVAAGLVAPNKRAQAIALMFTGLTLANVLGVPLGTALGQFAGWRSTFWAVTVIGLIAVVAQVAWLPKEIPLQRTNLAAELRVLGKTNVLLAMAMSVMASASLFSVFTYIAPILQDITGVSPHGVTIMLLIFGVGLTVGSILGGKLADSRLLPSLVGMALATVLIVAAFSQTSRSLIPAAITLFVWGVTAFALCPILQLMIIDQAHEAPNMGSTLNQSAFNLGNATGAWIGGLVVGSGVQLTELPWTGAALAMLTLLTALFYIYLQRRHAQTVGA
ncbi:DHA1 family inner membrane transport protein [Pseudomonas sp. JUb42]|jgi:DHA1 family inner membrane transport protein|uniref:MFS transporter n=1 Tax=Pseudomonas sp. JUb42 TaxID=2940611 RepID=UPI002168EB1D|nr:MFS transporter [Pseudomonas sp. JUb42]MCS3468046.1 DHA1 family inner membrane transport protein [Pseudomonas sp. JUb42]